MEIFLHIVFNFQFLSSLTAFVMSFLFWENKQLQFNILRVYSFIGFLFGAYLFYCAYYLGRTSVKVYGVSILNYSVIIHFTLLTVVLIKSIIDYEKRDIFLLFFIYLIVLVFLLYTLISQNRTSISHYAYGVSAFGLIIYSLIYFFRVTKSVTNNNLLNDPMFWFVVGVFISMGIVFPLSILKGVMFTYSKTILKLCNGFISIAYAVLYLFIAKTFYVRK